MFLSRRGLFRTNCFPIAKLFSSQAQCQPVSTVPTRFNSPQERLHKEKSMWDFLAAIKQCGKSRDLEGGRALHKEATSLGCDRDGYVGTALINMYSRCRSIAEARGVFENMSNKDVIAWTSLIQGYVFNGESVQAMRLYYNMSCERNYVTYVAALKACAKMASEKHSDKRECLLKGMEIHEELRARGSGLDSLSVVGSALLDMYSKCGSMKHALEVFDKMSQKDVVAWTCLIVGYVENGESARALDVFESMDCEADGFTFSSALKACAVLASESESERENCLRKGMAIHERLKHHRMDRVVCTTLVEMYSKCGNLSQAREIFDKMLHRDVIAWNSIIFGYVENGESYTAIELFTLMDCSPNHFTFAAVLKSLVCMATRDESERLSCFRRGVEIHRRLKERGFESDVVVASTLVDLYGRCGNMPLAREVFDGMPRRDVVAWTCLISRYTETGDDRSSSIRLAREVFEKMPQRDTASWNSVILGYVRTGESSVAMELFTSMKCERDSVTFVAGIKACTGMALESPAERKQEFLDKGVAIHKETRELGLDSEIVIGNCLVDMYGKFNRMVLAQEVFDHMTRRDVITWTSLIFGYVDTGGSSTARKLFMSMSCEPSCITFVAALRACASLADMQLGRAIHSQVCRLGLEQDQMVVNCLLDFYGKCSSTSTSESLFNGMASPDIVSWNAMLAGYSILGDTSRVFSLVAGIRDAGLEMTGISFISVLTACSHAGKVDEGRRCFNSMSSSYGVAPTVDHYTCMVDILGRANRLQEALEVVKAMPFEADTVTWRTLLSACKTWKNVEIAEVAFEALVARNADFSAPFVLMGDIYKAK